MSPEPESLILELLRSMRAEMGDTRVELKGEIAALRAEFKSDLASLRTELKSDMRTLRADVASDLLTEHKQTREQIVGLRRAVIEYHTTTIGHGILISELEARLRRVEQHLDLPPVDAH